MRRALWAFHHSSFLLEFLEYMSSPIDSPVMNTIHTIIAKEYALQSNQLLLPFLSNSESFYLPEKVLLFLPKSTS